MEIALIKQQQRPHSNSRGTSTSSYALGTASSVNWNPMSSLMRAFLICGTAGFAAANKLVGKSDVEMEPGPLKSPNGIYGISGSRDQPHSGLILAVFITFPHFSVSSAISLPNWSGDPGSGVPRRSARRAFILGSARAALTSLLSWSMISAAVALGTPRPYQLLTS